MATHFTQDALLDFLQRSGGSVKNADLLLHFRTFIRDHPDRSRNRELFKKFVNSVATVQQVESVSYVVLRKKFRGHVSGGSEQESGVLAGKSSEATAGKARKNPAGRAKKPRQKPQLGEVSAAAAPAGTTMLPAAGIVTNNKSVETIFNLQQVASTPDVCVRAAAPVPEPSRGTLACLQSEGGLHHHSPPPHSVSLHPQEAPCRLRHRQSYKSAVSFDDDEDEEETLVKPSPAGGAGPRSAPLGNTGRAISASSPCITDPPAPPSVLSSSFSSSERMLPKIYIQNVNEEVLPTGGPDRIFETALGHTAQQARPGREPRSFPSESTSTRRSLPLEAEFYVPPANQAEEVVPCNKIHLGHGLQPVDVQPDLRQGPDHSLSSRATGAWPDIYSLFREDSSLLNRCDFISGFTVLHWIAKHGDHRVLNTLWYGVQKVGLTFDINARSAGGHTPLHIAAIHGHKNIIRLLVNKFKADIKLRDMAGKKAWQYLSRTVPSDVFQLLGAPPRAVGRGDKEQQHSRRTALLSGQHNTADTQTSST
uniref:SOWAHA-C winged helix-turn-helix domain-containing protein n=1 Tax=Mola mola TaxID=94237 RepID=A0A3Q3WFM5_MOLML